MALQNKVAAEQTVKTIEEIYGPFEQEEIDFYKSKLVIDGAPLINPFQRQLIGYLWFKDFSDPITYMSIHNSTDYIKLIIASKRKLLNDGMILLPYIMSSKVVRLATRKIISKKDTSKYENTAIYQQLKEKYNSEKVLQKVWEFVGMVSSSLFQIIDYDLENHCPGPYDGKMVPMVNDIINEELLLFILSI